MKGIKNHKINDCEDNPYLYAREFKFSYSVASLRPAKE